MLALNALLVLDWLIEFFQEFLEPLNVLPNDVKLLIAFVGVINSLSLTLFLSLVQVIGARLWYGLAPDKVLLMPILFRFVSDLLKQTLDRHQNYAMLACLL